MYIKQVSVFLESKVECLEAVTKVMKDEKIRILSFSLADTSEYGMLRIIVATPEKAKDALLKAGFSAMISDVIAVEMELGFANFNDVLTSVLEADLNIEYMYTLPNVVDKSVLILKLSNSVKGYQVFRNNGFKMYENSDLLKKN